MHPVLWLAMAIGTEVVATTALKLFREMLDAVKLKGIGLIIIGVILLNGASSAAH